jgi:hypothetical protein
VEAVGEAAGRVVTVLGASLGRRVWRLHMSPRRPLAEGGNRREPPHPRVRTSRQRGQRRRSGGGGTQPAGPGCQGIDGGP